jgi:hypothetical protein
MRFLLLLWRCEEGFLDGLFNAASSIFNNERNISAAEEANQTNIMLQRENRSWQEQMANTSHQREVSDLKAAGLNPVLSAGGGSGAATPSSAAAHVEAPHSDDVGAAASKAFTDSIQRDLLGAQVKKETANAVSAGAEAVGATERVKNSLAGQRAKNDLTRTQDSVTKMLAPGRKAGLEANAEAGGMWKSMRSLSNRLGFTSAYEAATDGHWGADLYDSLHGGSDE